MSFVRSRLRILLYTTVQGGTRNLDTHFRVRACGSKHPTSKQGFAHIQRTSMKTRHIPLAFFVLALLMAGGYAAMNHVRNQTLEGQHQKALAAARYDAKVKLLGSLIRAFKTEKSVVEAEVGGKCDWIRHPAFCVEVFEHRLDSMRTGSGFLSEDSLESLRDHLIMAIDDVDAMRGVVAVQSVHQPYMFYKLISAKELENGHEKAKEFFYGTYDKYERLWKEIDSSADLAWLNSVEVPTHMAFKQDI